jgi:predicted 3-demethylubiquinone-9 3-methyltransferase (glyoxalase superfamily)
MELTAKKITPCLWFDTQAEEAAKFYAPCSRIPRSEKSAAMEKRDSRFTARRPERS